MVRLGPNPGLLADIHAANFFSASGLAMCLFGRRMAVQSGAIQNLVQGGRRVLGVRERGYHCPSILGVVHAGDGEQVFVAILHRRSLEASTLPLRKKLTEASQASYAPGLVAGC